MKTICLSLLCGALLGWTARKAAPSALSYSGSAVPDKIFAGSHAPETAKHFSAVDCRRALEQLLAERKPGYLRLCLAPLSRWLNLDAPAALRWVLELPERDRRLLLVVLDAAGRDHAEALTAFWKADPKAAAELALLVAKLTETSAPETAARAALQAAGKSEFAGAILENVLRATSIEDAAALLQPLKDDPEALRILCQALAARFASSADAMAALPTGLADGVLRMLRQECIRVKAASDLPGALDMARKSDPEGGQGVWAEAAAIAAKNPAGFEQWLTGEAGKALTSITLLPALKELAAAGETERVERVLSRFLEHGNKLDSVDEYRYREACEDAPALTKVLATLAPRVFDRKLLRQLAEYDPAAAEKLVAEAADAPGHIRIDLELGLRVYKAGDDLPGLLVDLNKDSPYQRAAGMIIGEVAYDEPMEAWKMIKLMPEGKVRDFALANNASGMMFLAPEEVWETVTALPPSEARKEGMQLLGFTYGYSDPRAGSLMLKEMDDAGTLDQDFLYGYLDKAAMLDSEATAAWLGKMTDEDRRRRVGQWILDSGQVDRHRFRRDMEAAGQGALLE